MDAVREYLDVEIPQPMLVEDVLPEFPHGVMVYPKLAGTSPRRPSKALARSAASVLRRFHSVVVGIVAPTRAVEPDGVAALVRSTDSCLTRSQRLVVEQWQAHLVRFLAGNPARCLIHGDYWHANWLSTNDGRTITGLLDFERCGIGFVQEDLAAFKYLGASFRTAALDTYCEGTPRDPRSLLKEVGMFEVLRELRGLDWALRNPGAGEVDDALEKVAEALAHYG